MGKLTEMTDVLGGYHSVCVCMAMDCVAFRSPFIDGGFAFERVGGRVSMTVDWKIGNLSTASILMGKLTLLQSNALP